MSAMSQSKIDYAIAKLNELGIQAKGVADAEALDIIATDASAELAALQSRLSALEDGLGSIRAWTEAYPLSVFPEPDFEKAHQLLKAGGMTLDSITASNMRHVIEGVKRLVDDALEGGK